MMDSNSMKPIYAKLKEQHRKGNLLIGIVVQKSDELRVTAIS
jgi:hypothetical protein